LWEWFEFEAGHIRLQRGKAHTIAPATLQQAARVLRPTDSPVVNRKNNVEKGSNEEEDKKWL
jgi:hypothetical protein